MTSTTILKVSDGGTMAAYVATPDDGAKHPGMIVFQEAFGVNAHIRDITERVSGLGYVAIAPELYHRTGEHVEIAYDDLGGAKPHRAQLTDVTLEADTRATYEWLTSNASVEASRIGAIGFCMGGRAAYFANTFLPLSAAVSFYGAGIAPSLSERAADSHGPIALFWGGRDKNISLEQRLAVMAALSAADRAYVNVTFSEADHGFHCDARSSYHPQSARQAWAFTAEFLKTYLT